ncbi:hypothetical protein V8C37DRAFT_373671 [Trichoderma ceciliae]
MIRVIIIVPRYSVLISVPAQRPSRSSPRILQKLPFASLSSLSPVLSCLCIYPPISLLSLSLSSPPSPSLSLPLSLFSLSLTLHLACQPLRAAARSTALTLLTICRYHLGGVQPASVVLHHLHLLRGPRRQSRFTNKTKGAKKAKRNIASLLFNRGRTNPVNQYP